MHYFAQCAPPDVLIAVPMEFAVMCGAQRHGKLVRDLPTECGGLRKFEVMRMGTVAAADKAGLRSDEGGVTEVADAPRLAEREGHFVDDRGSVTSGDGLSTPSPKTD